MTDRNLVADLLSLLDDDSLRSPAKISSEFLCVMLRYGDASFNPPVQGQFSPRPLFSRHNEDIFSGMTARELQDYVDIHIPIVKANGFTILEARTDRVSVGGSLADHVNHRDSAFGGSLSSALILAAWGRVRQWTETFDPAAVIVIAEQRVHFGLPVLADFEAFSRPLAPEVLVRARILLNRFGKARFTVGAAVVHRGGSDIRAEFSGDFVVVSRALQ